MALSKTFYKKLFLFVLISFISIYLFNLIKKDEKFNNYKIVKTQFSDLPGWHIENIFTSLKSFEQSCLIILKAGVLDSDKILDINFKKKSYMNFCKELPSVKTNEGLKQLIVDNFYPVYLESTDTLFTGYVELEIKGRREPSINEAPKAVPIFKKPPNIISVNLEKFGEEFKGKKLTGMIEANKFIPVPSRKIIENKKMFKEHILAYVDDPALAYFLHIQGSGVITLPSGEKLSVGYAGDNGKTYYSIGKKLIQDGKINKKNMSMQAILEWMRNNEEAAFDLMQRNERFIFFRERNSLEAPKGSSGTSVTSMHSAAIDNSFIPYHLPLWVEVDNFYLNNKNKRLTNIFIAQDTGSAIKGLTRIDLFLGKGTTAEKIAGKLNSRGKVWLLLPK